MNCIAFIALLRGGIAVNKDKKQITPVKPESLPKITLPWLIIAVSSMVMFMAFLIAMYFGFHTEVFFAVWMWIIAVSLFVDGISKRKVRKTAGNLSLCMGIMAFIAGVVVLNL